MRTYRLHAFGIENLRLEQTPDPPPPAAGEILIEVEAASLNYRDLLVIQGRYNPNLRLPAVPLSDGAGHVVAVGPGVTRFRPGDQVATHFVAPWIDGPFRLEYLSGTLGTPGPGLATEHVLLPADAVVRWPAGYDAPRAATLPIAALTAWSALVTVGNLQPGQTILTLGTGGVSIFALQFAKALGAQVIITSSSDEKLQRARKLGADFTINYRTRPDWENAVLDCTDGQGVDLVVETVGPGTLDQSMKAAKAGGQIALLGALTGRQGPVTTGLILMKRLRISGIMVDSRTAFEAMCRFIEKHQIQPVIGDCFALDTLPDALRLMASGGHFGKIVLMR